MDVVRDVLACISQEVWRKDGRAICEELAIGLLRRQVEKIEFYRNFCHRLGVHLDDVNSVIEAPALPQAVYKTDAWLGSEPRGEYAWFFKTSGTTSVKRGVRPVARMDVYEEASVAGLMHLFVREFPELVRGANQQVFAGIGEHELRLPFFFVKESTQEAPESSLSWMFEFWRRRLGTAASCFVLEGGRLVEDAILEQVWREPGQPVVVAGTALGFLGWAEHRGRPIALPPGSVVIETGGFKGRRREMPKRELYALLSEFFCMPQDRIVNEYGMTEIFSQSYARGPDGVHVPPPWLSVRIVDPFSGRTCVLGQPGVLELVDLACVDCVPAVQTEDLAVMRKGGIELLGRASAELRGCSLGAGV